MSIDVITLTHQNLSNTYIVGNNEEVIIIDPSSSLEKIVKAIDNKKVLGIFLTHGHYDHFKTISQLQHRTNAKCYMHFDANEKLKDVFDSYALMFHCQKEIFLPIYSLYFLKDKEEISLNQIKVKVLFTPGHTNCSVVYLINNFMFSGDTLFKGAVGRSDLSTSNANDLLKSVNYLLNLKTNYLVYPGHEGATSIVEERNTNPFYQK